MDKRIMVTGISGYVGLHMTVEGLKRGYSIRGTVRSDEKAEECQKYLKNLVSKEELTRLEVAVANLTEPNCWDEAIKDCDAILHVASPLVASNPKDKNELISTARTGVKHVFEAAMRQGVTRIIYTSSVAAVMYGHDGSKSHYTESDWSNAEGKINTDYAKSKTLAEQDAWQYAKNYPELELTTILPGGILGPIITDHVSPSTSIVYGLLTGEFSLGVPNCHFPIVDVRDIVTAHLNAIERDQSIGERIMLGAESIWIKELAEIVKNNFPNNQAKISLRILPKWLLSIFALFNDPLKQLIIQLDMRRELSYQKAQDLLDINPRSPEEAVLATAKDIIRLGLVS